MNAEPTHDLREQAEARIVALLLGEASPFEEAAVQDLLKQDAGLTAFHEEMKRVLSLVQAASAHNSETQATNPPPPQLSPERRQMLLQKLEKPVAAPVAIVPFPFWRRRWFISAAAAASVLGLLGLFLWFYEGNLRPRFQISSSPTGAPRNPFVNRYAYVTGAKSQPAKSPERGFASPTASEHGLAFDVSEQPVVANQAASTRSPARIVLPTDSETRRGVVAGGAAEFAQAESETRFGNGIVAKDAEVTSRDLNELQSLGEAGQVSSRGRQSGASSRLSRAPGATPSAPATTAALVPSAGTVVLPTGDQPASGRMAQKYYADTDGGAPPPATITGSVEGLSTIDADLQPTLSVPVDRDPFADSAGRRIGGGERFLFKTVDDARAKEKRSQAESSVAIATNSFGAYGRANISGGIAAADSGGGGGFGGGGAVGGNLGTFEGRALDRADSLADKSGVEPEQAREIKMPQSSVVRSIVRAQPEPFWDEKKLAAGYPLSAGSLVVLPQGEAKPAEAQADFYVQAGKELNGDALRQDGGMDRLQSAALGVENRWGMVSDTPTASVQLQETPPPQSQITAANGPGSILGDTPVLGRLFGKESADATAESKMVPLKVELPKLGFIGTPPDITLNEHIESPEETQAKRDALFRSSMIEANAANKTETAKKSQDQMKLGLQWRDDAASADSKSRVRETTPVPAPARTDLAMKLADVPGIAGKPAVITPSRKAVSELAQTKGKIVEQETLARTSRLPPPTPQPEMETRNNAFSTFSLNVSDVSFRLAAASLEKGVMPDPAAIRSEEFVNAFDYRDPLPQANSRLSFAWERARYPFAHNREIVRLAIRTAARGREPGRPLNLVVALDHSGSMERADRVAIVQEAMKVLAGQLQPQDRISVILFARTAQLWVDGLAGGKPQELLNRIRELNPQGGTNLEDALALAYQTALKHFQTNGNNRVIMMTDGAANLGNVDPSALQQTVETHRKKGIALDCFGIGWEGFNDDLLEVLARHGDGRYGFLNSVEVVKADFANQLAGALQVAAADVKAQVEFNPKRVTTFRQIGYARHQLTKEQFRDNTVDAAEIGAAESGNALYVIQVNPQGEGPLGVVRVRFKVPATGEYQERSWDLPFQGRVTTLDQSAASLRLAAASAAFAEWLATSPYAAEVNLGALESQLNGVAETFAPDPRPQRLAWMIRQARSLSGK